jgi:hypothetical protein
VTSEAKVKNPPRLWFELSGRAVTMKSTEDKCMDSHSAYEKMSDLFEADVDIDRTILRQEESVKKIKRSRTSGVQLE